MRAIPNSGPLQYLEISNIERVFPTTPEVLKAVLYMKDYGFSKLPRVTNEIDNILGKKGLLLAKGEERKVQRKLLLPAFPHAHIKGLVSGFWPHEVEMFDNVAPVEEGVVVEMGEFSLVTLNAINSSSLSYEFYALKSASINGSSNTEEKSGSELADAYNTIFNMGDPSRIVAMLSMIFPFRPVQSL